ncbi:MAG: hypothetical protein K2Y14_04145 [Burkholderiales bacterium]|nr:hypothetical protein [Burkholderiales bacterium]
MQKQNPDELALICRGFFIRIRKDIIIENKTEVKLKADKGAVKMSELIEKHDKLRKFLYFAISIAALAAVLVPIAIGVGVWIANH